MANPDLSNQSVRYKIIQEIKSDENKRRKAESLRRFEVYKERQSRYIEKKLLSEFSDKTVREMRKITSINLAKRMIDEVSSLYNNSPERNFGNVTEVQKEQCEALYKESNFDTKMLYANRLYKLNDQVILQIVPWDQKIVMRPLLPHHVDVVPDEMNPEKPFCYILSVFDKFEFLNEANHDNLANPGRHGSQSAMYDDGRNQGIADPDDYKALSERYEVWSDQFNFIMDGKGNVVSNPEDFLNPIGEMPFVDVSTQKDFEFWVRQGNGFVDFAIDFGAQLSDIANIIKLQGYAQCVMTSTKVPENMLVGPNHILWLEQDPNSTKDPKFEFVAPSPDLASSLEFLEMTIRLFLASKGIDAKTISGKLEGQSFSSGLERLLSMVTKFEASKQDMELFRYAEEKAFKIMSKWSNLYQGTDIIKDELQIAVIPDDATVSINYYEPQAIQTKQELEDSVIKRLDNGLLSKKEALKLLDGLDDVQAEEKLKELEAELVAKMPITQPPEMVEETEVTEVIQ